MNTYETCQRQYELTYVNPVIKYQETEATIWGTNVHLALENYCKSGEVLANEYAGFKPYADKILSLTGIKLFEEEMALDAEFKPVAFDDPAAVLRGIIDVCVINGYQAIVADWKTGKIRADSDQLKLFALFVMKKYPEVRSVKTCYVWLKFKSITSEVYTREDLFSIVQHFGTKMNRIRNSYDKDRWIPKTSGLCNGWCGAGKHCEFWRPRRTNK